MESFLRLTAQHLCQHYGDRLSDIAVIFPNNRARLFFSEHLLQLAGKPIWTPSFLTINNLFEQQSTLRVPDTLSLVARLYHTFQQVSERPESFDEFYLWGELLLNDFDDVDKNLADASQLFRTIKEQAAFTDTLEHLTDEQVSVIRRFFDQFEPGRKTELKRRFIENWNCLMQVYTQFNETLSSNGLAYEGMLKRRVIEGLRYSEDGVFAYEKYAFVGFNILNECEKELFRHLKQSGKALFYWDYDISYLKVSDHEAGRFMRQNLEQFPNQLDKKQFNTFEESRKHIDFIASSSENAQARYLPDWIQSLGPTFKPEETAVVLCNESLLLPVLHSIPESVTELNVTMGFPLSQAPVSNLLNRMCQLHTSGFQTDKKGVVRYNFRHLLPILQHPLVVMTSPSANRLEEEIKQRNLFRVTTDTLWQDAFLKELFTPVHSSLELAERLMNVLTFLSRGVTDDSRAESDEDSTEETPTDKRDDPLFQESVFQCYTLISRIRDTLSEGLVEVGLPIFGSLLQRVISVTSIPFSGEPVRGMQIMGMLETRTLDFKHVLILSVNEGMLPKSANDVSFIPYNLRKSFGLTTTDHKDSIFAYYFFRLLQRAERITLAYNTSSEGLNRGEMSRFMLQLLVESPHPVHCFQLKSAMGLSETRNLVVEKTAHVMEVLSNRFDSSKSKRVLSPTALNTYINCPLRFYFRYVAGIKEQETISDEIDGAMLGTCFHHAAEYLYTDILLRKTGKRPTPADIEAVRANHSINGFIHPEDFQPWLSSIQSLEKLLEHVMGMDFFHLPPDSADIPDFSGEQKIRQRLLTHFLRTLVELDKQEAPFSLVGMETQVEHPVPIDTANGIVNVRLGGTIDRRHEKDGCCTVVDYKTGGTPSKPASIEELFKPQKKHADHIFQLLTYCAILYRNDSKLHLKPRLLYINKAGSDDYTDDIQINKTAVEDYADYDSTFWGLLETLLQEVFDPAVPFHQCDYEETCTYCPYKAICKR